VPGAGGIVVCCSLVSSYDLALNAESHDELMEKVVGELGVIIENGHQVGDCDGVQFTVRQRLDVITRRILVQVAGLMSLS